MTSEPSIIWVLTDGRAGTDNQALGVAEKTGLPFMEKRVKVDWTAIDAPYLFTAPFSGFLLAFPVLLCIGVFKNPGADRAIGDAVHRIFHDPIGYWRALSHMGSQTDDFAMAAIFLIIMPLCLLCTFYWTYRLSQRGIRVKASGLRAPWPDAVISAGRKASRAARVIRENAQREGKAVLLAQIMKPELGWNGWRDFDILSIPAHDRVPRYLNDDKSLPEHGKFSRFLSKGYFAAGTLLRPLLAPHRLTKEKLAAAKEEWQPRFTAPKSDFPQQGKIRFDFPAPLAALPRWRFYFWEGTIHLTNITCWAIAAFWLLTLLIWPFASLEWSHGKEFIEGASPYVPWPVNPGTLLSFSPFICWALVIAAFNMWLTRYSPTRRSGFRKRPASGVFEEIKAELRWQFGTEAPARHGEPPECTVPLRKNDATATGFATRMAIAFIPMIGFVMLIAYIGWRFADPMPKDELPGTWYLPLSIFLMVAPFAAWWHIGRREMIKAIPSPLPSSPVETVALPRPWIGVLIGGAAANGYFISETEIATMLMRAEKLAGNGALLVTTSRRTGPALEQAIAKMLEGTRHYYYRSSESGDNPYLGVLACADALVVTPDSVSMVSEACYTGKPVYIASAYIPTAKHSYFLELGRKYGLHLHLSESLIEQSLSEDRFAQLPPELPAGETSDSAQDLADHIVAQLKNRAGPVA